MATQRRPRTKPRVNTDGDGKASSVKDQVTKNQQPLSVPLPMGSNGLPMIEVVSQSSETVPVAQFANVVIGPCAARRLVEDPGLAKLVGTDPEEWNAEQQAIADQFKGEIAVMNLLIQEVISEDREAVEESVRLHNEREAERERTPGKKK